MPNLVSYHMIHIDPEMNAPGRSDLCTKKMSFVLNSVQNKSKYANEYLIAYKILKNLCGTPGRCHCGGMVYAFGS